jgi:hypothetical protein
MLILKMLAKLQKIYPKEVTSQIFDDQLFTNGKPYLAGL